MRFILFFLAECQYAAPVMGVRKKKKQQQQQLYKKTSQKSILHLFRKSETLQQKQKMTERKNRRHNQGLGAASSPEDSSRLVGGRGISTSCG
jgi:hypothetical protein